MPRTLDADGSTPGEVADLAARRAFLDRQRRELLAEASAGRVPYVNAEPPPLCEAMPEPALSEGEPGALCEGDALATSHNAQTLRLPDSQTSRLTRGRAVLDPRAVGRALESNREALSEASEERRFLSALWRFAVELRREPALADLDGFAAAEAVGEALAELTGDVTDPWRAALPDCADSFDNPSDPLGEFVSTWQRAARGDPLARALAFADGPEPLLLPLPEGRPWAALRRFARVAAALAAVGEGRCYLPVRRLGELLDVTPRTVSSWRSALAAAGLLREVAPSNRAAGRATAFTWLGPLPQPTVDHNPPATPAESE